MTIVVPAGGSSGIASAANYLALKTSIAMWLNRTDLDSRIPDFVFLAESEIGRDTRIRSSYQVVEKSDYSPDGKIALPADLLELRSVKFIDQELEELPLTNWKHTRDGNYYARVGTVLQITNAPAGAYTLTYIQRIPQLVFDSDSNWLLRDNFDIYLWKGCEFGSAWLRDPEAVAGYKSQYELAVQELLTSNNHYKWGSYDLSVRTPGVV